MPNLAPMFTLRPATAADASALHALIVELAVYEREPDGFSQVGIQ